MLTVARAVVRRLEPSAGARCWIDLEEAELRAAAASLLDAAGAVAVSAGDAEAVGNEAPTLGVVDVDSLEGPLVPERLRRASEALVPGGRLAVVVRTPDADGPSVEALAEAWRPRLGLARAHGQRAGESLFVVGPTRRAVASAERKRLRGLGHGLDPSVLIGRSGLSAEAVAAVADALARHGLIKIKLTPQCGLDKNQACRELARAAGGVLVQRVGRTGLLFRPDVPLEPPIKRPRRR